MTCCHTRSSCWAVRRTPQVLSLCRQFWPVATCWRFLVARRPKCYPRMTSNRPNTTRSRFPQCCCPPAVGFCLPCWICQPLICSPPDGSAASWPMACCLCTGAPCLERRQQMCKKVKVKNLPNETILYKLQWDTNWNTNWKTKVVTDIGRRIGLLFWLLSYWFEKLLWKDILSNSQTLKRKKFLILTLRQNIASILEELYWDTHWISLEGSYKRVIGRKNKKV